MTVCFLLPSQVNNALLITHGALSTLGLLLLDLAGAVQRSEDAGLELVGEEDRSRSSRPFFLLRSFSKVQVAPSNLHLIPNLSLQLVCPVFRCLSNLLTETAVEAVEGQMQLRDERVVAALFILLQFFLQKQPSLLPEGLWLLNNLTGMHHNLSRP